MTPDRLVAFGKLKAMVEGDRIVLRELAAVRPAAVYMPVVLASAGGRNTTPSRSAGGFGS